VNRLAPLLAVLRPLLRQHRAKTAYLVGSWARGEADAWRDVDLIIVAPSSRPFAERFKDDLPAIIASPRPVELFVCTPEEFERMPAAEERPFLMHAPRGVQGHLENYEGQLERAPPGGGGGGAEAIWRALGPGAMGTLEAARVLVDGARCGAYPPRACRERV